MKSALGGNVMTRVTIIGKLCCTSHLSLGYQVIGFAQKKVCLKCVYKQRPSPLEAHWKDSLDIFLLLKPSRLSLS